MALPKAMQEKLDAMRKEEEEEAGNTETNNSPDTQASAPTESNNPEPTAVVNSEGIAHDDRFDKLSQKFDTLLDRLGTLQQENEALRKMLNPPKQEAPPPAVEIEDLTDEEKQQYKQSLPTITKLAKKLAAEQVAPLQEKLATLQKQLENTTKNYESMSENSFVSELRKEIPDMQTKLDSPRWREYVESVIPRTNITVGQALLTNHKARNLKAIKEIFDGFTVESQNLLKQQMPGTARVATPPEKKDTLKWSDRKQLSEEFRKGRITQDRFDKLVAVYEKAEQEGRIDFSS